MHVPLQRPRKAYKNSYKSTSVKKGLRKKTKHSSGKVVSNKQRLTWIDRLILQGFDIVRYSIFIQSVGIIACHVSFVGCVRPVSGYTTSYDNIDFNGTSIRKKERENIHFVTSSTHFKSLLICADSEVSCSSCHNYWNCSTLTYNLYWKEGKKGKKAKKTFVYFEKCENGLEICEKWPNFVHSEER